VGGAFAAGAVLIAIAAVQVVPVWAGSGVAVLVGVLAGLMIAGLLRETRFGHAVAAGMAEQVLPSCLALGEVAVTLAGLPVWPASGTAAGGPGVGDRGDADPDRLAERVADAARALALRPEPVRVAAAGVVGAAADLAGVITDIRATSRPGYRDAVAVHRVDEHTSAVAALTAAHETFVAAVRADLGVDLAPAWRVIVDQIRRWRRRWLPSATPGVQTGPRV
jgi:hypothetical protein